MDTLQFLQHRASFTELPFGELQDVMRGVAQGGRWQEAFHSVARRMRRQAETAEISGRAVSAAQAWRWTASAYHVATFGLHLEPELNEHSGKVLQLRHLARLAYLRALGIDSRLGLPVKIPYENTTIHGYLRAPFDEACPLVVLLNGLDSICEVEMHTFGTWLLARGLAVLSLDLPASFATRPRAPRFEVEEVASVVADWITSRAQFARSSLGAFGVSFGGHLVARLLSGDARFKAGVAVSPAAWLGYQEFQARRIRLMFGCAFDLHSESAIDALAAKIRIDGLPSPEGRLLIFQMEDDQLFGTEHVEAFCDWGKDVVEVCRLHAEHVGTSRIHCWLPEACDWLSQHLS